MADIVKMAGWQPGLAASKYNESWRRYEIGVAMKIGLAAGWPLAVERMKLVAATGWPVAGGYESEIKSCNEEEKKL